MSPLAAQRAASPSGSSFGTGGFGISASASATRGKEAGDDLVHANTHITAGNRVNIQSGGDTTLQGALVKADTIKADIGGNLLIESLQDTSTYDSKQSSVSASVTIGVGASGSFSASKSKVNSDFASVAEQSGFKAGDGGFRVKVQGDTELIGGAIASNQSAVAQGLNEFSTGGTLTTIDIQNKADYSAQSTSVGVGGGSDGQKKGMSGVGVGVGSDSGSASSTTTAGISGIAGDTAIRSTDAEAGIARIFEKERVQKEIAAQMKITEAFSREAPKAVASYAAAQERSLKQQLRDETDSAKQEALQGEINKWGEGGVYRVALHTASGALGGGWSGAAGAAVSGASADLMQALQDNLQQGLEAAGMGDGAAKGIAQSIATLTAAGLGAAVGGAYGAASAATVDANNRQLHPTEAKLIKENSRRFAQKLYGTAQPSSEQIEAAQAMLTNTAQNAVDNNWGFEVPYLETADAFLQQLKIEYQQQNGSLALPGTSGQPGGVQQLFYADVEQKNQAWINQGLVDPAITGLIVRTPIKPQTNPDALDLSRDRLTGLSLDKEGRYTVRVDLGNPIDGYETYTPKYFPCATAECVRSGQNLDMSDAETRAYVRALDAQVFKDIATGATAGSLVAAVGVPGAVLTIVEWLASGGQVALSDSKLDAARDEVLKGISEKGGEAVFRNVLQHPPAASARIVSLVGLAGGWGAFTGRVKTDLLGLKSDEQKKQSTMGVGNGVSGDVAAVRYEWHRCIHRWRIAANLGLLFMEFLRVWF